MLIGSATPAGTARYASRFHNTRGFFRQTQGLTVSSLGLGTYLGAMDADTDDRYTAAIRLALARGVNLFDTSLNYRNQRSERNIGAAIRDHARDEFLVCTKAGYLVPQAVPLDRLTPDDIVGEMHSMATPFLADQLDRSRRNLGVETIDIFYLHNPETQLQFVPYEEFETRLRQAFEALEQFAADGKIKWYGAATWEGFRKPGQLRLDRMSAIAHEVGGANHKFRFIQLPFSLAMPEGYARRDAANKSLFDHAAEYGIAVVGSATILQRRLAAGLPEHLAAKFPGATTDAQRAIQFARSTPGIAVSLVGMGSAAHVEENAALAYHPPLTDEAYAALYQN